MPIRTLDVEALRRQYREARPFPFICIENFLEPDFAAQVAGSYPTYSRATQLGSSFSALNENLKVQVCDYEKFPDPVKRLSDALHAPEFLESLSTITGIPKLRWDEKLRGGGMHQTASSGHLDVHIDFNRADDGEEFRRLNILVYLNPVWEETWGGKLELWDREVKHLEHAFVPVHNRCVIFETSSISFHGVTAVRCPPTVSRKSFAAYYYTAEPPPDYKGVDHTTIFKARPTEKMKRYVWMPAAELKRGVREGYARAKRKIKTVLRPS